MNPIVVLAIKGMAGGTLVVGFAMLAEGLRPKSFAGLFGAAPSIALTSLVVTVVDRGAAAGHTQSTTMIVGAVAMAVYCVTAAYGISRLGARRGSVAAFGAWATVAAVGYAIAFGR